MVAAHINQFGGANKGFNIQETTLLPSIRGFGALVAMIFCPAMDLKRDKWKSRYISVRTGLGYDSEKAAPYFVEHDTIFPLDFELTEVDLCHVRLSLALFFNQFKNNSLIVKNRTHSSSIDQSNTLQHECYVVYVCNE